MKRFIVIQNLADLNLATLNISEVQRLNIAAKLIHITEKPDKTWRLMHSTSVFANLAEVKSFEFENFNVSRGKMNPEAAISLRGLGTKLSISTASPVVGKHRYLHLDHEPVTNTWKMLFHSSLIDELTLTSRMAVQIVAN